MRRVVSVVLFILAGWAIMTEVLIAWVSVGQPFGTPLAMIGVMTALSAPLLLLGMWVSPGNRIADAGATLIAGAAIGAFASLSLFLCIMDPNFTQYLPPGSAADKLRLAPLSGMLNLVLVAGGGWLLWRYGRRNRRPEERRLVDH